MRPPTGMSGCTTPFISPALSLTSLPQHLTVVTRFPSSSLSFDFSTSQWKELTGVMVISSWLSEILMIFPVLSLLILQRRDRHSATQLRNPAIEEASISNQDWINS